MPDFHHPLKRRQQTRIPKDFQPSEAGEHTACSDIIKDTGWEKHGAHSEEAQLRREGDQVSQALLVCAVIRVSNEGEVGKAASRATDKRGHRHEVVGQTPFAEAGYAERLQGGNGQGVQENT